MKAPITSKFPLKGVFAFESEIGFSPPVVKKTGKFWYEINLKTECNRTFRPTFILQFVCNESNLEEAKEFVEKIYKGEIKTPIIKARAVLPRIAKGNTVIKCYYAPQEELVEQFKNDPKKRVIKIVAGVKGKTTYFPNDFIYIYTDNRFIGYLSTVCQSGTGLHWEVYFLHIYYRDNPPVINDDTLFLIPQYDLGKYLKDFS